MPSVRRFVLSASALLLVCCAAPLPALRPPPPTPSRLPVAFEVWFGQPASVTRGTSPHPGGTDPGVENGWKVIFRASDAGETRA